MMDVHLWFRGTGASAETGRAPAHLPGHMWVSGLSAETTETDIRRLLERYYSTVGEIKMQRGGAQIAFGKTGERDRCLIELQGTTLMGARLSLSKLEPQAAVAARPRKRQRDGSLVDDEIQTMLLERETHRRRRDYVAADRIVAELRTNGVMIDTTLSTWRSADGRTGYLPSAVGPAAHVAAGSGTPSAALDETRCLYARLSGDESIGTHTLRRILAPFNIDEVSSTRDGYALCNFVDAGSAATALSLSHYTPTGRKISLISSAAYRQQTGAASLANASAPPLPAGWTCGWSAEWNRWYYANAEAAITQWEFRFFRANGRKPTFLERVSDEPLRDMPITNTWPGERRAPGAAQSALLCADRGVAVPLRSIGLQ